MVVTCSMRGARGGCGSTFSPPPSTWRSVLALLATVRLALRSTAARAGLHDRGWERSSLASRRSFVVASRAGVPWPLTARSSASSSARAATSVPPGVVGVHERRREPKTLAGSDRVAGLEPVVDDRRVRLPLGRRPSSGRLPRAARHLRRAHVSALTPLEGFIECGAWYGAVVFERESW